MSIRANRVSKVIIGGNWISVEPGSFRIVDMQFTDDDGNPLHGPLEVKAYQFRTENHDDYYGPLSAIELIKLTPEY
ncbi:MAG: hypothetical protein MUF83_11095 [Acidimicrobiales bacterium]|jgi:hypothetical protein|nr:hypothetical protein [Acidimicrobiales bacterium]